MLQSLEDVLFPEFVNNTYNLASSIQANLSRIDFSTQQQLYIELKTQVEQLVRAVGRIQRGIEEVSSYVNQVHLSEDDSDVLVGNRDGADN